MSTLPFGSHRVWDECATHDIDADVHGDIAFRVVPNAYLKLIDSGGGGVNSPDIFVLCNATVKSLSEVLKVCQAKRIPLGFTIEDAVLYVHIFIVGTFSANDQLKLTRASCTIQQVMGATGKERAEDLRQKLG